ncbi:MAG: hypothetical protein JWQ72_3094 [Polaromonas sp.]|nr:hypothetical protein [Polaromonas sp.]
MPDRTRRMTPGEAQRDLTTPQTHQQREFLNLYFYYLSRLHHETPALSGTGLRPCLHDVRRAA